MHLTALKINFSFLSFFVCFASCKQNTPHLPYYNDAEFTPVFISSEVELTDSIKHTISDFSFFNQEGKTITQKKIEGKIHVANFFFTSCGSICPVMMENIQKASTAFDSDTTVVFLSYSAMPWKDSIGRLKEYATEHNIKNKNWSLLTGKKEDIYQLARRSYFVEGDMGYRKDSSDFLHTEHVILVDKNKHIRGIYNGTLRLEIEQLIKDIEELKQE